MSQPCPTRSVRIFVFTLFLVVLILDCSPPVQRPSGPAAQYADATDLFAKGKLNRAIEYSDSLAKGSPANNYTDRARVLRVVIFSGQIKGDKELGEAYAKGFERTRLANVRSVFAVKRHDNFQLGASATLNLVQVAHQLTEGGTLPKDLQLEAPYPAAEGPMRVTQLTRVLDGGAIDEGEQEKAAMDAQRKGIDEALGEIVGGGRAEARSALKAGPVKLDGYKFALFLTRELLEGASIFDRKHMHDPEKFRTVCGQADEAAKAALATLKDNPDKAKAKEVKKLQDEIKTDLKNA